MHVGLPSMITRLHTPALLSLLLGLGGGLDAGPLCHEVCDPGLLLQLLGPRGGLFRSILSVNLSHHSSHELLFVLPPLLCTGTTRNSGPEMELLSAQLQEGWWWWAAPKMCHAHVLAVAAGRLLTACALYRCPR